MKRLMWTHHCCRATFFSWVFLKNSKFRIWCNSLSFERLKFHVLLLDFASKNFKNLKNLYFWNSLKKMKFCKFTWTRNSRSPLSFTYSERENLRYHGFIDFFFSFFSRQTKLTYSWDLGLSCPLIRTLFASFPYFRVSGVGRKGRK